MSEIGRPISKPTTSRQVNDITIFMKLKYRSAMSFEAIFKTDILVNQIRYRSWKLQVYAVVQRLFRFAAEALH